MIFPQRLKDESGFQESLGFFEVHLRHNSDCRLTAEYPLIFRPEFHSRILVKRMNDKIVAGLGMLERKIEVEPGVMANALFIGSVVTDPSARLQGFQRELFHAVEEIAERDEVDFLVLWSSQIEFYHKLGFFLGGLQATWAPQATSRLKSSAPKASLRKSGSDFELSAKHFRAFESRPMRVQRTFDEFRMLSHIPEMQIAFTENAYAIMGKGEDFRKVVHEWAGPSAEVISCLEELRAADPHLKILSPGVLHTEEDSAVVSALEMASFEARLEYLGLIKIISQKYSQADFDPTKLKVPFFIWGLDSI